MSLPVLPRFSDLDASQVTAQINGLLNDNRQQIQALLHRNASWAHLIHPLEILENRVHRYWSAVSHLHSVCDTPSLREAYNAALPLLTEYSTEMEQNETLYRAYLSIRDHDTTLDAAQRHIVNEAIRNFELSGIGLPEDKKKRYAELQIELSDLGAKFEQQLMDATMAWTKHINDPNRLSGLPESARAQARDCASAKNLEGWLFSLEAPSYLAIMTYADDRDLREEMYRAYCTRASDQGPLAGQFDNSEVMTTTLRLRHELANLLGFKQFSDLSLASKMAGDAHTVEQFLLDLAQRSQQQARVDLAELQTFARTHHGRDTLAVWDVAYYSEKLRQERYQISEEVIRQYFPESHVLKGVFDVAQTLFGVTIIEVDEFDRWHPSVRLFQVMRGQRCCALFYVDLHARPHKRGGAWMDDAQSRFVINRDETQLPIAFLTCNFAGPVDGQPALFTHDDVITLLHEFGHGLHHMLSEVNYLSASGIHGVEWDAVELPSQFMENYGWDATVLKSLSAHVDSGEPLPDDMIAQMLKARNFQSSMQMLRQIEFSLFDWYLHDQYNGDPQHVMKTLHKVRAHVAVIVPPEFNRFAHSFSHIFAGGYAAGYYSYKWAEVLSADAFAKFEEEGLFNRDCGDAFCREILAVGGTRPAAQSFAAFRGRAPTIDALLRHNGIGQNPSTVNPNSQG